MPALRGSWLHPNPHQTLPALCVRLRTDGDLARCHLRPVSAATASPRLALPDRALTGASTAPEPVLLTVGNRDLVRLAVDFVVGRPPARSLFCAHADVLGLVFSRAIDLILLDVDGSLTAGFVLAAHIRAADRSRGVGGTVAIVATTSSECKFQDCLVGGSAIDGALKMPCDFRLFADCVDRWCRADDFRPVVHPKIRNG